MRNNGKSCLIKDEGHKKKHLKYKSMDKWNIGGMIRKQVNKGLIYEDDICN